MARLAVAAVALVASVAWGEAADAPSGAGVVVFSLFSGAPTLRGDERCEGLYAARPDGGGLTRLTGPDTQELESQYWPSFAPSGRVFTFGSFARRSPRDLAIRLFRADLATGRARALGRSDFPSSAAWSPKGDAVLVYRARGRSYRLARIDVRTGRARDLGSGSARPRCWLRAGRRTGPASPSPSAASSAIRSGSCARTEVGSVA